MGFVLPKKEVGNPWQLDSLKFNPPKLRVQKHYDYHIQKCLIQGVSPFKQSQVKLSKYQYYDKTNQKIQFPFQKAVCKYTKIIHYHHDHHLSYTNITDLFLNRFHGQLTKQAALPFKKIIVNNKNLKMLHLNQLNERINKFIRNSKSLKTVIIEQASFTDPILPYSPNLKEISIKIFDLGENSHISKLLKLQKMVDGKPNFEKEKKQISFHFDLYSSHGEVKGQQGEKIGLLESFFTQKFQFPKEFDLGVNLESIPSNFMEFTDLLSSIDYLQMSPPFPRMRLFNPYNSYYRESQMKQSKRIFRLHFREEYLHGQYKTIKFLKCMTGVKVIDIPFIQEAYQMSFLNFIYYFNTSQINTVIISGFELSNLNKGLQLLIDDFLIKFQDLNILEIRINDMSVDNVLKENEIISSKKKMINVKNLRIDSVNHTTWNYYALLSIVNLQSIHDLYIQIWDTNLEEILDKCLNQMPNLKDLCIEIYNGSKVTHLAEVDWQNINLNSFSLSVIQNYNDIEQFMKNLLKKINSKRVEIQYRQILQEHVKQVSRVVLDEEGISEKIQHLTLNLGNYDKSGNLRELAKTIFNTVKNLQTLEFISGLFVIAYLQREVYSDARKRVQNI